MGSHIVQTVSIRLKPVRDDVSWAEQSFSSQQQPDTMWPGSQPNLIEPFIYFRNLTYRGVSLAVSAK